MDWRLLLARIAGGITTGGLSEAFYGAAKGLSARDANGQTAGGYLWDSLTGKTNTDATNSATAALQEDAQQFNAEEAAKQREFESAEAEKARAWQAEMSNTAVQRQSQDLQAAGFNPWLAVSGSGASTGSVGIASGNSASSAQGQGINATKSGIDMIQTVANAAISAAVIMKVFRSIK